MGEMKFHTLTSLFFVTIVFLLSYSSAHAAKPAKNTLVGANLRLYNPPAKQNCDINVPAQYATIQEGINAAVSGDTVCVGLGIFNEDVIINKSIRLSGRGANKQSIIYGQTIGTQGAVWVLNDNVVVEGFLISGAGSDYTNAAVHLSESVSGVTVRYNRLIAGNYGLALLTDGFQNSNLIQNNILEGRNSPQVAFVNGTPSVSKASDNVDFLNNTFKGSIFPTERNDSGVALTHHATNSSIERNIFEPSGTITKLIDNAYGSNNININNFKSNVTVKVHNGDGGTLNAEDNWWGDTEPSDNIQGDIDFTPFATVPFPEN